MSLTQVRVLSWSKMYAQKLAIAAITVALVIFAWLNLFFYINIDANAATVDGVSDQLEGKVQKDIGTKRRAVGDLLDDPSEQAKGMIDQAKGETKQTMGSAKNKLDNAQDTVADTSDNLVDSVKDFFN